MGKETKKELEEILKEQRKEYQRYLSVLSEDFHSNMQLVAESVSGFQEQLEAAKQLMAESVSGLQEQLEAVKQLMAESVSGLQEQLEAVRQLVADGARDIAIIKGDIQFIKQELKRKVDCDEFEALERRVLLLEKA